MNREEIKKVADLIKQEEEAKNLLYTLERDPENNDYLSFYNFDPDVLKRIILKHEPVVRKILALEMRVEVDRIKTEIDKYT